MQTVDRVSTPDGHELTLYLRDGDFYIYIDGQELMSSRLHSSEEALAELTCRGLGSGSRVLIGGLGLGFTLTAALKELPYNAEVVVAELFPCVVGWHRDHLGELGAAVDDPRVRVAERDVWTLADPSQRHWNAILIDTDNGPEALCVDNNRKLYTQDGTERIRDALVEGGVLGVWATDPDSAYMKRLRKAGFSARTETVRAHRGKGSRHTIFLALTRPSGTPPARC